MGTLTVIHGSMFAGKTECMIGVLREARAAGKRVVALKHAIDDRYDPEHLVTHRGDRYDAARVPDAAAIPGAADGAEVVAVDEAQFFGMPLIDVVRQLLARGVDVVVAGITHDAWGRPFEPIPQLCALAGNEKQLCAPCRVCGEPAVYTQRMVPVDTHTMVGGLDEYEPRCATHFTPHPSPPEQR